MVWEPGGCRSCGRALAKWAPYWAHIGHTPCTFLALSASVHLVWMPAAQAPSSQDSPASSEPSISAPVGAERPTSLTEHLLEQGEELLQTTLQTPEYRHLESWGHHTRDLRRRQSHGPGSHRPRRVPQSLPGVRNKVGVRCHSWGLVPPKESLIHRQVWSFEQYTACLAVSPETAEVC